MTCANVRRRLSFGRLAAARRTGARHVYREADKELARARQGFSFSNFLPAAIFRRKGLRLCTAFVLLALAAGDAPAQAQKAPPTSALDTARRNAVQMWIGSSPGSVRLVGKIEGARLRTMGVRYLRILGASRRRVVEYTADVLPLASITYEPVRGAPEAAVRRGERTLRGIGVSPLGLRIRGQLQSRWQPYVEGGLGFIYFAAPLPDRRGERLNFTLRAGVGVWVEVYSGVALTLGYRLHHLSNGFRGQINPGFDSNLFYLGVALLQF